MLNKLLNFALYGFLWTIVIFIVMFIITGLLATAEANGEFDTSFIANPPSLPKTEFTTHRKVDNEMGVVCYTTVMLKYGEISELSMSCVPLSSVCDYSERKVSKISETVQDWANSQD